MVTKLLFIVLIILGLLAFRNLTSSKTESSIPAKPKYLCDNTVADCSNLNNKQTPKNVCAPGGKCSSSS